MPPQKPQSAPDFIPDNAPDFIPASVPDTYDPSQHSIAQNFQKAFDELIQTPTFDSSKGMGYNASVPLMNLGVGAFKLMTPFFHPLDTIDAFIGPYGTGIVGSVIQNAKPMAKSFASHPVESLYQAIPAFVSPEDVGGTVSDVGDAVERGGTNLGNAALGARGPKFFKSGENPARGAFEEDILPAMSKHSAAMKLPPALERVGQRVSGAVDAGGDVPLSGIATSIESPANEARGIIEGPGGANRSFQPVEDLVRSMERRAPGASAPIYGPNAGTRFTANEAAERLAQRLQRMLPAPTEHIPLADVPYRSGRLSRPIILEGNRPMQMDFPAYGANAPLPHVDLGDIPGEAGPIPEEGEPWGTRFNGMKFNEHIGEIPGTRGGGGHGQVQGYLLRPSEYPESSEPSGLTNLRHPYASSSDVWKTIQNIDKNTRFNPDPEVEGLNEIRREMRGRLRRNLEQAAPGVKAPSQTYSDLKGAEEALDRTMHTGTGLQKMMRIPGFPLESTLGRGMYEAGKGIKFMAPAAAMSAKAAPVVEFISDLKKKEK